MAYSQIKIPDTIKKFLKPIINWVEQRGWAKRIVKYLLSPSLSLFLVFIIINTIWPVNVEIGYSRIVLASDGSILGARLNKDDKWRMYITPEEISPELETAILAKEDQYFYYHPGVNFLSVVRAAWNNVLKVKRTSGASTITMQVARLLAPAQRTYFNKLLETFRAFQLEWTLSKKEILQLYLNLLPYGGNIEGVKAASFIYFQKSPDNLSVAELTTLTIIPNRPNTLLLAKNNALVKQERNKWLDRFSKMKLYPADDIDLAMIEPLEVKRHSIADLTPHLNRRLCAEYDHMPIIRTHVNKNLQMKIQRMMANYVQRIKTRGVNNAAVLVINNKTRAVEAYVGSADFTNAVDDGEVDGVKAIRSPGSTLKPLLYAACIDEGFLSPKSKIADVEVNYHGYMPENYDTRYHGLVTLEYALANSLNIPAVKNLDKLSLKTFISMLESANFKTIKKQKKDLGLSMILGGCGASLEEITNLFVCFAKKGEYNELKWVKESDGTQDNKSSTSLFSAASAYIITTILSSLQRPDFPVSYQNVKNVPQVAWKTGTSYGRRDGWSIGYNPDYTIGIWTGNFDGGGSPALNGADVATPLLFEVFNEVDKGKEHRWFSEPDKIKYREVCTVTGMVPNSFCTSKVMDVYIPGVSENIKCRHKRYVWVDAEERFTYCSVCMSDKVLHKKLVDYYEPELLDYFRLNNIPWQHTPPHYTKCKKPAEDGPPQIISPVDQSELIIEHGANQKVMLKSYCTADVERVSWFLNDKYLKTLSIDEQYFIHPDTGKLKITCTDDRGRSSTVYIQVNEY